MHTLDGVVDFLASPQKSRSKSDGFVSSPYCSKYSVSLLHASVTIVKCLQDPVRQDIGGVFNLYFNVSITLYASGSISLTVVGEYFISISVICSATREKTGTKPGNTLHSPKNGQRCVHVNVLSRSRIILAV